MPDDPVAKTVEIDGLVLPEAALLAAEQVIHEWERSGSYRALDEVVKIYRIISASISQAAGTSGPSASD